MVARPTRARQASGPFYLVDPGTEAVLAVKESAPAATRSAGNISGQRHGKPVSIWLLDRALRPGACITDAGGALVAEIDNGRWSTG
jgi:hypothetical protein